MTTVRSGYSHRTVSALSPTVNEAERSSASPRRRFGRCAGLALAAWEFPHAREVRSAAAPRDEIAATLVLDQRRDDFDDVRQAGSWRRSASSGRGRTAACAVYTTWRRNP